MSTLKQQKQYFNQLDGKKCACPYCHTHFVWPPEQLCCPSCKRTIRPPVGYTTNTPENKEVLMKRIEREHEKKIRELGPRRAFKPNKNPMFFGIIIFVFIALGAGLVSQAQRANPPKGQPSREEMTIQDLQVLAQALNHYKIDVGNFPLANRDGGLTALVTVPQDAQNWNGPYISGLHTDGWGRPYFYELVDDVPRLLSIGEDKRIGTEDDLEVDVIAVGPHPDFKPFDAETNNRKIPTSRIRVNIAN